MTGSNIGYFHLGKSRTTGAMKMSDLRAYSGAAVMYYGRDGKLVEDLINDYLETSESTISPIPMVVSEVMSATALLTAVKTQHITSVYLSGIDALMSEGLRWELQYGAFPVYIAPPSGGKSSMEIKLRNGAQRTYTLGMDRFVTGTALNQFPLSVSSGTALSEVLLYNGRDLYRRFVIGGKAKSFNRLLLLDSFVHRNINIVVTDVNGGTGLAHTRRWWKPGSPRSVIFCGDHFNACDSNGVLLAHGPTRMLSAAVNEVPPDFAVSTGTD
jgi:hypothetical protein